MANSFDRYGANCDYLRQRYGLVNTANLYELVDRIVVELKALKEMKDDGRIESGYRRTSKNQ